MCVCVCVCRSHFLGYARTSFQHALKRSSVSWMSEIFHRDSILQFTPCVSFNFPNKFLLSRLHTSGNLITPIMKAPAPAVSVFMRGGCGCAPARMLIKLPSKLPWLIYFLKIRSNENISCRVYSNTITRTHSIPPDICAVTESPTFIGGSVGFGIVFVFFFLFFFNSWDHTRFRSKFKLDQFSKVNLIQFVVKHVVDFSSCSEFFLGANFGWHRAQRRLLWQLCAAWHANEDCDCSKLGARTRPNCCKWEREGVFESEWGSFSRKH